MTRASDGVEGGLTIRATAPHELARVEDLLAANGLPADVRASPGRFYVATVAGRVVGAGGVERYGTTGLLRSVVVDEADRGRGYGRALCVALEDRARAAGVTSLVLLTTTAAPFFRALGYEVVEREAVNPAVRQSSEFSSVCPSTATCMRKLLEE